MELIKKKFKLIPSGSTTPLSAITGFSGDTGTTGASYTIKLLLTSTDNNFGFFNSVTAATVTGTTITHPSTFTVTGESKSRIEELRKYTVTQNLSNRYFITNNPNGNGLDLTRSNIGDVTGDTLIYYVSGITYREVRTTGTTATTFSFVSEGLNSQNFINKPIIKDESIQEIIAKPKVSENIFIDRQQVSVFENNYRLRNVRNITELQLYAGGNFYNIINNT